MKNLIGLLIVLASGPLFAQMFQPNYQEIKLFPGQSEVFYDYNSQQAVQVTCVQSQPMPPPIPPPGAPPCSVKYNAPGSYCGGYQVYKNGQAATACVSDLNTALGQMRNLISGRVCSQPRAVGCDIKYNAPGSYCGGYQVYAYLEPISICLAGLEQAQQIVSTLRANGICM